ncbi:MAG: hypothetical protein Q9222_002734 [Ikaeria aurantiellina]
MKKFQQVENFDEMSDLADSSGRVDDEATFHGHSEVEGASNACTETLDDEVWDNSFDNLYTQLLEFNPEGNTALLGEMSQDIEQDWSKVDDYIGSIDPLLLQEEQPMQLPAVDTEEAPIFSSSKNNGFEEDRWALDEYWTAISHDPALVHYNYTAQSPPTDADTDKAFESFLNFEAGENAESEDAAAVDVTDTRPDPTADSVTTEKTFAGGEMTNTETAISGSKTTTDKRAIACEDNIASQLTKRKRRD